MPQRLSAVRWTQRIPAGLPSGIPGIGDDKDGAIQHAPHPALQFITLICLYDLYTGFS
jgi:hypothetical protein